MSDEPISGRGYGFLAKVAIDRIEDALGFPQHIDIEESQHAIAMLLQPAASRFILVRGLLQTVLAAVEFDDEFCACAEEVCDVGTDRLLPSNLYEPNRLLRRRDHNRRSAYVMD